MTALASRPRARAELRVVLFRRPTRYGAGVQSWNLLEIEAPGGHSGTPPCSIPATRVRSCFGSNPGQTLGDHQVRERAWADRHRGRGRGRRAARRVTIAGAGTLVMFDPGERHSVSSAAGARLLLLLAPWPAAGHYGDGRDLATDDLSAVPLGDCREMRWSTPCRGASAAGARRPDP